jgi:cardiolipin synthase
MKKRLRSPSKHAIHTTIWSSVCTLIVACFYWLTFAFTNVPQPSETKPTEFYSTETKDNLRSTYIQAIKDAKSSIFLSIFSLTDMGIINALRLKSVEGINVTVIYDANASEGVHRKLGGKVKAFSRKGRGLMHQKILVIDDIKSWIGSANFTPSSLRSYGNLVTGFYSRELARTLREKAEAMIAEGKVVLFPRRDFQINGQTLEMWFLPDNKDAISRIKQLIQSAQKTVKVGMFTWTRHDLANEIIKAKSRGINAEVVIDKNSGKGVSAVVVRLLSLNGILVRTNQGSALFHHKFMIIDDEILLNGSANWTKAAFTQNDDCFIILHHLTNEQQDYLHRLWEIIIAESEPIICL